MKSLAIFLPFVAAGAFANGGGKPEETPQDPPRAESSAASTSDARAGAYSSASVSANPTATSIASGGDSTSSASSGGNQIQNSSTYKQVKQAPGVFSSAGDTTAECQGDWRVGLSATGGGLGFGKSYSIRDCYLVKASDTEFARGNIAASIKLRCRISFYRDALGDDCEALLDTQTVVKEYATKEDLKKAFEAAIKK